METKNIVISGLCYPVTAALEYITRAFKNLGHNVRIVGPYFGNWIPWTGKNGVAGMTLPDKYVFEPDIKLPKDFRNCPTSFIESQLGDFVPDVWLDVNAGFHLEGIPKNGIRTTFLTDPHVLRRYYDSISQNYQFIFNPQNLFRKNNEFFVPYAADDEWNQWTESENKEYDVVLIGNTYHFRVDLVNTLRSQSKSVLFELGIGKMDLPEIYAKSKIGLNWGTELNDLNARVFEIICSGLLPVMNRVPDLEVFFKENENYLGFSSKQEAIEKIDFALNNPEICQKIKDNNLKIRSNHLWENRVNQMLETIYANV